MTAAVKAPATTEGFPPLPGVGLLRHGQARSHLCRQVSQKQQAVDLPRFVVLDQHVPAGTLLRIDKRIQRDRAVNKIRLREAGAVLETLEIRRRLRNQGNSDALNDRRLVDGPPFCSAVSRAGSHACVSPSGSGQGYRLVRLLPLPPVTTASIVARAMLVVDPERCVAGVRGSCCIARLLGCCQRYRLLAMNTTSISHVTTGVSLRIWQ
jgi:hypothetical protein